MTRIVVLDGYTLAPGDVPWTEVETLGALEVHERTSPDEVVPRARGAEIVLTNKTPITAEAFAALDGLRFVSVLATGYDVIDLDAATRHGVIVSNVPEYGTESVAQFTIALVLTLCHHPERHDQAVRDGEWARREDFSFSVTPQVGLWGKTLGIIGFGRIGRRVGEVAHTLGMRVIAHDPSASDPPAYSPFAFASLDVLAREADVVTLHCPQTEQTVGLVDASFLGRLEPGAMLVNTARGGLVVEADLAAALQSGHLAAAAVDVVSVEPIEGDNPLLGAPNLLVTPHMAWASLPAREALMRATAQNIAAYLAGAPVNVVGR